MPLTGPQADDLVEGIVRNWSAEKLELFLSDHLDLRLDELAPVGTLRERAVAVVSYVNGQRRPRDREFLQLLRKHGDNAALEELAGTLLTPPYYPDGDALDAVLLGKIPFVGRQSLRELLRPFVEHPDDPPRVLVVRGAEPGGKSYTWEFLRHLAARSGALAQWLPLADMDYRPRQVLVEALTLLGLSDDSVPPMADDPQDSHLQPLVNSFMGAIPELERPSWLVIDDLNHPRVALPVRELAYALAKRVEYTGLPNLHLVLLGYNDPIPDARIELRTDRPQFPEVCRLAQYLTLMASASGGEPLPAGLAAHLAELLVKRNSPPDPSLTKECMQKLSYEIGQLGRKLWEGKRL